MDAILSRPEGKKNLVTGAASDIGRVATRISKELGDALAVCDLDETQRSGARQNVGAGSGLTSGVASDLDVWGLVASVVEALGGADVVLSGAGMADTIASAIEPDAPRWQPIVDVTFRAMLIARRALGRDETSKRRRSVVSVAFTSGLGALPRETVQGADKTAVSLDTCNLPFDRVAPAHPNTLTVSRLIAYGEVGVGRIGRRMPLGRFARLEEKCPHRGVSCKRPVVSHRGRDPPPAMGHGVRALWKSASHTRTALFSCSAGE